MQPPPVLLSGKSHGQRNLVGCSPWGREELDMTEWLNRTELRFEEHPTPVLLSGKSQGWRSLIGCSPWGREESDMTERLHFPFSLSCTGEGNGNPFQCSCLENPRDGGAWRAAVYGVAQNRTRLKWLSSSRKHFNVSLHSLFDGHSGCCLEKAMAPHSSTLAWKISWMEEPGRLQSMGLLRIGHDWATSLSLFTFMHWRRKWQPTPVFLPGESQGWGSLVGCNLWGCTELDTTEVT